jgi:hypothetical protein
MKQLTRREKSKLPFSISRRVLDQTKAARFEIAQYERGELAHLLLGDERENAVVSSLTHSVGRLR